MEKIEISKYPKEANLMNNTVITINKKDLLCKSTQDKLNRSNIRYNLFNTNRTNNINKYRNNIHNNIIKNNYKLSSSTSVKNIFSDKRTTNDSTNNTRFLRKGINSSFTSAVNSVNNDFRVNILQSAKSTKNIFLKYTRDSPLISQIKLI